MIRHMDFLRYPLLPRQLKKNKNDSCFNYLIIISDTLHTA